MASLHTTRASLFARIRDGAGDPAVWRDFVATYGPVVVRWSRRHGLQDSDAQDVAQEVLVRFWRQADRFRYDPDRRFRGYLRRMVVTAVADWSTTRQADRLATGDDAVQELLDSEPAREELAARIESTFDVELLSMAMREVEGRVKPTTWAAFRLLALERLPGREVATRLGIDVNLAYVARLNVQRMISGVLERFDAPSVAPPHGRAAPARRDTASP